MINKFALTALIILTLICNTSCNSNGTTATDNNGGFIKFKGIEYNIVKDSPGDSIKIGEIVEFHIVLKKDDITISNSRTMNNGKPIFIRVAEPKLSGEFQSVFTKLSVGDSCLLKISCDTIINAWYTSPAVNSKNVPWWLIKGKIIKGSIVVVTAKSEADYNKESESKQAEAK